MAVFSPTPYVIADNGEFAQCHTATEQQTQTTMQI